MSEEQPKPRKRNWIFTICKITFFATATILVILLVMSKLGGSSPALKQSIEDFLSESTPYSAKVAQLNYMGFFPDITFDFQGVQFYDRQTLETVATVDHVQVALGFWDVMASTGKIKALNIRRASAAAGVLLDTEVRIESAAILDTLETPRFEVTGTIGGEDLKILASMTAKGIGRGKKYSFGREREIEMTLGDLALRGTMRAGENAGISFDNIDLGTKDKKILGGTLSLVRNPERTDITGDIEMEDHHTDIRPEITLLMLKQGGVYKTTGLLASENFHTDDFSKTSGYGHLMDIVEKTFGKPETMEGVEIDLDAKAVYHGSADKGPYEGPLALDGWRLDVSALGKK